MKQCPACKTTYTDDSLSFCLSDGTSLIEPSGEEQTVVRSRQNDPVRVDIGPKSEPTLVHGADKKDGASTWIKLLIAAVVLIALAVIGLGLAGAAFYYGTSGKRSEPPTKSPPPTPAVTATPDDEKDRLRDELANIQKQLDERTKNSNTWTNANSDDERGSSITATVNSPKDGFLALRSEPDADRGERIAKIPHGAEVEIQNCEKNAVTIASRTGRWCQVDYNGLNGWVFDAWLDY